MMRRLYYADTRLAQVPAVIERSAALSTDCGEISTLTRRER